jgi:hypothetical protein
MKRRTRGTVNLYDMKVRFMTSRNYLHLNIQSLVRKKRTAETHGAFLVNDQREAYCFTMYLILFLFLTLYMFRAHRVHHQE